MITLSLQIILCFITQTQYSSTLRSPCKNKVTIKVTALTLCRLNHKTRIGSINQVKMVHVALPYISFVGSTLHADVSICEVKETDTLHEVILL